MSAAQKAPYEKKAADAKQAYEKAIEEFKAQGGVAGSRRKEKADARKDLLDKRAKKRARQERDADKPKKPQTAYWLWLAENRAALANEAGMPLVRQWRSSEARGGRTWTRSSRLPLRSKPLRRKRNTIRRSKSTRRREAQRLMTMRRRMRGGGRRQ